MTAPAQTPVAAPGGGGETGVGGAPLAEDAPSRVARPLRALLNLGARRAGVAPVIASSGRAGSTMLNDAAAAAALRAGWGPIGGLLAGSRRARIWAMGSAWDMARAPYRPGIVYKTHDYPPATPLPARARVIYVFADPVDVALSVLAQDRRMGRVWVERHFAHLRAPSGENAVERLETEDSLRLGDHFDAWMRPQAFPVLLVKYRALWDHADEIGDFLGLKLRLPPYRARAAQGAEAPPAQLERLARTYGALRARMAAAPDFQRLDAASAPD